MGCAALLFMQDMAEEPARRAAGRWSATVVRRRCPSVRHFVVMDGPAAGTRAPGFEADASFLAWVVGCCTRDPVEGPMGLVPSMVGGST